MIPVTELWMSVEASMGRDFVASAIRLKKTGIDTPLGGVLIGVDASRQRHLCIPAPKEEVGLKDLESGGILLEVRPLIDSGVEKQFVTVVCRIPELNALFAIVAEEMVRAIQARPDRPFAACQLVMTRWRTLLERPRTKELSTEALASLLAELLLLEELARRTPRAAEWWLGPDSAVHDFVCGTADFEVKSSLRTSGRVVEVSDLSQLETSPGTDLYLVFRRLRHSPGRGESVPSVIRRLQELGCDSALLFTRLAAIGYDPVYAENYARVTFETLEEVAYLVDNAFPRLTRDSFTPHGRPPQVTKLRYSITLDGPSPTPLSPQVFGTIIESVCRGAA